jgi:hypothetical protein
MVVSQPVLLGMSAATLKHRVGLLHEAASLLPRKWWVGVDCYIWSGVQGLCGATHGLCHTLPSGIVLELVDIPMIQLY